MPQVDPFNQMIQQAEQSSEEEQEPSFYESEFSLKQSDGMFKESPDAREELKEEIEAKIETPTDKKVSGVNFIARNK